MEQRLYYPATMPRVSLTDGLRPPALELIPRASLSAKCGVSLRAFRESDLPTLYNWRSENPEELFLWYNKRGVTSEEGFRAELYTLEQKFWAYGLITNKSDQPCGIIYAYPPEDFRTSASVGIYLSPEARGGYTGGAAFGLFARHMFVAKGAEKLRIAVAGWNQPSFDLITKTGHLHLESVLDRECIYNGDRWPLMLFSHWPEDAQAMQEHRLWRRLI